MALLALHLLSALRSLDPVVFTAAATLVVLFALGVGLDGDLSVSRLGEALFGRPDDAPEDEALAETLPFLSQAWGAAADHTPSRGPVRPMR
jgi:hypothetical protein